MLQGQDYLGTIKFCNSLVKTLHAAQVKEQFTTRAELENEIKLFLVLEGEV